MDTFIKIGKSNLTINYILQSLKESNDEQWTKLIEKNDSPDFLILPILEIGYLSYIYRIKFVFEENLEFFVILKVFLINTV